MIFDRNPEKRVKYSAIENMKFLEEILNDEDDESKKEN